MATRTALTETEEFSVMGIYGSELDAKTAMAGMIGLSRLGPTITNVGRLAWPDAHLCVGRPRYRSGVFPDELSHVR